MALKNRLTSALAATASALLLAACTPNMTPGSDLAGLGAAQQSAAQSAGQSENSAGAGPQSGPQSQGPATNLSRASQIWDTLTARQQAASVLMLSVPGTDAALATKLVEEVAPAGLLFMTDAVPADETLLPAQIEQLQAASAQPLLIAVDQEGGLVQRIKSDPSPGPEQLRTETPDAVQEAFSGRGEHLANLGFNTNFGIVADVTDSPDDFIYARVLGTDEKSASSRVAAAVTGEAGTVQSAIKHFPGHGPLAADSHVTVPTTQMPYAEWRETQAPPFIAGIDAGTDMVMMGHLVYADVAPEPASLSPKWHQVLRDDLGFDGIIVTDDMKMLRDSGDPQYQNAGANAVAALQAGATLILDIGQADQDPITFADGLVDSIAAAVDDGELPEETLRAAGVQLLAARLALSE